MVIRNCSSSVYVCPRNLNGMEQPRKHTKGFKLKFKFALVTERDLAPLQWVYYLIIQLIKFRVAPFHSCSPFTRTPHYYHKRRISVLFVQGFYLSDLF